MTLNLPALDEAYHRSNRRPIALVGPFLFLALIVALVQTGVLPVPKVAMTATLAAFWGMIVLTTIVFHRWGFHSLAYRVMLLLETLVLTSGLAVSMAGDPPGLPILWAFYLLICVVTALDVGASQAALAVVLTPVLALFAYQLSSSGTANLRHFSFTLSGGLLSAALFLFFGNNRQTQLELTRRQMETERELSETKARLETQERVRAVDESWLSVLSKVSSALLLVDGRLGIVAVRRGAGSVLDGDVDSGAGLLPELRPLFDEAAHSREPVARYGMALPNRRAYADIRIVALPEGEREERFAVLVQDATARVKIEQENQQLMQQMVVADKLGSVGLLAAGVAHEVNNPLSYVMGNVEYLLHVEDLSERARSSLGDIDQGLHQIASIVGDLRGFSYNSAFAYRHTVDLVEVLRRAERLVVAELRQTAAFRVEVPGAPVYVRCQAERVQQVIVNLLINASQALPERPSGENRITLTLEATTDEARIRVSDNGVGMSEAAQQKAFDLFYTTKPAGKGTGLGLSIAYNIARDHDGTLTVQSAPGQGSTFVFTLPRSAKPEQELRLLVVDDEQRTLDLFGKALENFHVTTATSVAAGRELLGNRFDAVLCDVRLSDGSGFDLHEMAPAELKDRFVFYTALPPATPELRECPPGRPMLHKPLNLKQIEQELYAVAGKRVA
jgi:signal transduction histidine kinase